MKSLYKNWRLKKHVEKFGSKNIGYFLTFDKKFFEKWQRVILFGLNTNVINIYFRWVFRIHKIISFKEIIYKIAPNFFEVQTGENTFKRITFTHNKFSKRIYYGLFPVWWILHFIDWLLLERFELLPNFGFATLTAYPDPHTEVNTVDGIFTWNASDPYTSMNSLRNLSNSSSVDDVNGAYEDHGISIQGYDWATYYNPYTYYNNKRYLCLFDTSTLTANAIISSAKISLKIRRLSETISIGVVSTNPSNNTSLVNSDFGTFGLTVLSNYVTPYTYSSYHDFNFNSSGISAISKTGISKFGFRTIYEIANYDPPSETFRTAYIYTAEMTGASSDPYLEIVYTIPTTNQAQMIV